jgi:mono/diheme cytochrome c family protein
VIAFTPVLNTRTILRMAVVNINKAITLQRQVCWLFVLVFLLCWQPLLAQEMPTEASSLSFSKLAAERGKSYYLINCQQCHDADGRALASIDFIAANLTAPDTWYYGTEPLHVFRSIKFGAGLEMPPFKDALDDETIWQIVAHVFNIGPKENRPTQE